MKFFTLLICCQVFIFLSANAAEFSVRTKSELLKAISDAKDGDKIRINTGKYSINELEITKSIQLIGVGKAIFDGGGKAEILRIKANGVTVRGLQFENVGYTSTEDWAAIKVLEASDVIITDNTIINAYFGIYLSASKNCLITGNNISGSPTISEQNTGNGFHAWKCDSLTVKNNKVKGQRDGLYFEFVTSSVVEHNHCFDNVRYGLHFMFSHKNSYAYNTFERNGAGVAVMYTKFVSMKHNVFKDNLGGAAYGILLKDITDSEIEDNQFLANTVGILMEGCNRIDIRRNEFRYNGVAMRVQANCEDNNIDHNNFVANTFDMATNGNAVSNTLQKNYWDKYEGYDLDKNGYGDIPYRPVSLFSTIIERMPQAMMLLRSFTATLLDKIEKVIPSFTPENLKDDTPLTKPLQLNHNA